MNYSKSDGLTTVPCQEGSILVTEMSRWPVGDVGEEGVMVL